MKKIWRYLITLGVSLIVILILFFVLKRNYDLSISKNVYRILIDSFFTVGFILICISGLVFIANEGTFDMMVFGLKTLVNIFKGQKNEEKYYDYHMRQLDKEKKPTLHYLIVGGVLIIISLIFILPYYLK